MARLYRAFGLRIASDLPLGPGAEPDLSPIEDADVRIRLEDEGVTAATWRVRWEGVCSLSATPSEVRVAAHPGAGEADLALAVSGAGLALVLEERGIHVLHGSCVAIGGVAVCLLGDSGVGKSTLATALQRAGHRLVSDGMTAIALTQTGPVVSPGWPKVKLLPDAARTLGWTMEEVRLVPGSTKVLCDVAVDSRHAPVPLVSALVLAAGSPATLAELSPGEGVFALVRNFFLIEQTPRDRQRAVLQRSARLATHLSVSALQRGTDLSELKQAARLVEEAVSAAQLKGGAPDQS